MYASITIVGHLGSKPELRHTQAGHAVTNLSVAVNSKRKNAAGETIEKTFWYRVSVWNVAAENAVKYLDKGSLVLVEGSFPTADAYTDKQGQPAASVEFDANVVRYLNRVNGDGTPQEDESVAPITDEAAAKMPF